MVGGFSDEIQVIERPEILPGSGRLSQGRGHLARKRGAACRWDEFFCVLGDEHSGERSLFIIALGNGYGNQT